VSSRSPCLLRIYRIPCHQANEPGERRPTGTELCRKTEPALWAVRSTGLL